MRARRKAPKPSALAEMPSLNNSVWECGSVRVTEGSIEVEDPEKGTFIIKERGMTMVHLGSTLKEKEASHREECSEKNCPQCLFQAMDRAREAQKDEWIGGGAQGVVYKFLAPPRWQMKNCPPLFYVRKEVSLDRCEKTVAPVSVRCPSEDVTQLIASAIQGEFHRQYYQSDIHHIVKMYCARLNPLRSPSAPEGPLEGPASGTALSQSFGRTFSMSTSLGSPPQRTQRRTAGSVEFVMEYMDYNLDQLRQLAGLVDQRILNRIVAKYPSRSSLRRDESADRSAGHTLEERLALAAVTGALAVVVVHPLLAEHPEGTVYQRCHPVNLRRTCGCAKTDSTMPYSHSSDTRGVLPESIIITIFKQLACALQSLGNQCILHNDIKPSNILVNRDGYIKFSDFGTSKKGERIGGYSSFSQLGSVDDLDRAEYAGGSFMSLEGAGRMSSRSDFKVAPGFSTMKFRAPELSGESTSLLDSACGLDQVGLLPMASEPREPKVTGSADVWALALSMLVLATPNAEGPWPPWMLKQDVDFDSNNHCIATFNVPSSMSHGLQQVIAKCMRHKPETRLKPNELKDELHLLMHPFDKEKSPFKCMCSDRENARDDPEGVAMHNPITPFLSCLQRLTQPKVEADKVADHLQELGLTPLQADTEPADYALWCTTTQRHLARYFPDEPSVGQHARGAGTPSPVQPTTPATPGVAQALFAASSIHSHHTRPQAATVRSILDAPSSSVGRGCRPAMRHTSHTPREEFRSRVRHGHYSGGGGGVGATAPPTPPTSPTAAGISLRRQLDCGVQAALGTPRAAVPLPAAAQRDPTAFSRVASAGNISNSSGNSSRRGVGRAAPHASGELDSAGGGVASLPADKALRVAKLKRLYNTLCERERFLQILEKDSERFYAEEIQSIRRDLGLTDMDDLPDMLYYDLYEHPDEHERGIQARAEREEDEYHRRQQQHHKGRSKALRLSQSSTDIQAEQFSAAQVGQGQDQEGGATPMSATSTGRPPGPRKVSKRPQFSDSPFAW